MGGWVEGGGRGVEQGDELLLRSFIVAVIEGFSKQSHTTLSNNEQGAKQDPGRTGMSLCWKVPPVLKISTVHHMKLLPEVPSVIVYTRKMTTYSS